MITFMWNTNIEIQVLYKSTITNKLVQGNYSFFIFSLNQILITSIWAQDKNLVPQ